MGPGAPLPALQWDFGLLDMGLRVWVEKIMLMLHIRRLNGSTLANKIYEEQRAKQWPGLAEETKSICQKLDIECVHETNLKTKKYRKIVLKACHKKNKERLKRQAEGKEKCWRIAEDDYGKKAYIKNENIQQVRDMFRTRFGLQPFAGNYSKDRRFARTNWLCRCQMFREEESHLLSGNCEVYGDIRRRYDNLDDDANLVQFFNEVLQMRDALEEKKTSNKVT